MACHGSQDENSAAASLPPASIIPVRCHFGVLACQRDWKCLADSTGATQWPAGHFTAKGHVSPELPLHGLSEDAVIDQYIQLVVSEQTRGIQVARADSDPTIVAYDAFGVEHRSVPLIDSDPTPKQVAIPDSRQVADQGKITGAGHQQTNIDAITRRVAKGLEQTWWGHEVCIGDPEPLDTPCSEKLDDTVGSLASGLAADHSHFRFALRFHHAGNMIRVDRRTCHLPYIGEALIEQCCCRSLHLHRGVPPWLTTRMVLSSPLATYAKTAQYSLSTVGNDELAVIAGNVGDDVYQLGRVKGPNLHPCLSEVAPEAACCSDRTEPIVQYPYLDAFAGAGGQPLCEAPASRVAPNDVVLEMDPPSGLPDYLEHGPIGIRPIDQQLYCVARNRPAARSTIDGAADRLFRRDRPHARSGPETERALMWAERGENEGDVLVQRNAQLGCASYNVLPAYTTRKCLVLELLFDAGDFQVLQAAGRSH